jgi:hypothetical protein
MSCQRAVYQWTEVVTTHMPHLSKPQAAVLAAWSVGMVLARSCALTAVSLFLARGLDRKANTVRQQLREWWKFRGRTAVKVQAHQEFMGQVKERADAHRTSDNRR